MADRMTMNIADPPNLLELIADRTAVVGVIGQGYVGLPLSLLFSEEGFPVLAFDIDSAKIEVLNRGRSYISHVPSERIARAIDPMGRAPLRATNDFSELVTCDAILICVPTPLGRHRDPDLHYVMDTTHEISRRLRKGQLIVLESTTYPGTTDEELLPLLETSGLRCPDDFLLAFSPEREDPGNRTFTAKSIPKVVGGVNLRSTDAAIALYSAVVDQVVPVSSSRVAEASKLLENIYRSVNIALVNELKMTFDRMGIDIWEVIEAAKTKPFGFQAFYPGPGLGGHCIPLDPFYLAWKAAEYGVWTRFIELAGEINTSMPAWVVSKVSSALSSQGKVLKGARILILGLAYKPDVDDDRESPSYELMRLLRDGGAEVSYCDPHFPSTKPTRRYNLQMRSVPLDAEEFAKYDAVLLATAHREFLNAVLYRDVRLLIDTRNVIGHDWALHVVRA